MSEEIPEEVKLVCCGGPNCFNGSGCSPARWWASRMEKAGYRLTPHPDESVKVLVEAARKAEWYIAVYNQEHRCAQSADALILLRTARAEPRATAQDRDEGAKRLYEAMTDPNESPQGGFTKWATWEQVLACPGAADRYYRGYDAVRDVARSTALEEGATVLMPMEPTDELLRVSLATDLPATFKDHLRHPDTEIRIAHERKRYANLFSALQALGEK